MSRSRLDADGRTIAKRARPATGARRTATLKLIHAPDGYWCEIRLAGQSLSFRAAEASEAYAEALLYVMEKNP